MAPAREARFGEAIALLNVQPRTAANVERARELLEIIAHQQDADEVAQAARLFLARVDQMHRAAPDEAGAVKRLPALHDAHPDTQWGQMAVLLAAPSMLYASRDPAVRAAALEELETRAARITMDAVRRPLHLTLARA